MDEIGEKKHYSRWLARIAALLGIGSVAIALVSAIGAGQDYWPKLAGLGAWRVALVVALVAIVLSLIVLLLYRKRDGGIVRKCVTGLVFALLFVSYVGYNLIVARSVPAIHDITTDLENPPKFMVLEPRKDNFSNIPGRGDAEFAGMDARERWVFLHRKAYGDVQSIELQMSVADAVALAEKVALASDWVVAKSDPEAGRMEATDSVSLFEFKDDVVVRVTPAQTEGSVKIDVRSVSRLGMSDLGVNANRIRKFLKTMQTQAEKGN